MFVESLSLPFCLIKKIYDYIPNYNLYHLSKSYFNRYVDDYFNRCKSLKSNRFYQDKINNTYIRYLIRNDMYVFIDYLISSSSYTPWNSIKRYTYKNKMYKTYLDYCIYLANEYESEQTKVLLSSINKSKQKKRKNNT